MLSVLGNTLYMQVSFPRIRTPNTYLILSCSYGGIYEYGSREYTLDDFHSLRLDKLERYVCLKPCDVTVPKEGEVLESSSEDEDDDDDDEEEEEEDMGEEEDGHDDVNVQAKAADQDEDEPEMVADNEEVKAEELNVRCESA